jgi:hypothetical protein
LYHSTVQFFARNSCGLYRSYFMVWGDRLSITAQVYLIYILIPD